MPILLAYRKLTLLLPILASWSYASLALLPISHLGRIISCLSLWLVSSSRSRRNLAACIHSHYLRAYLPHMPPQDILEGLMPHLPLVTLRRHYAQAL